MNRSEVTYHRDIFIPTNVTVPARTVKVEYSGHALAESAADRYGSVPRVTHVNLAHPAVQIIEVTLDAQTRALAKVLVRIPSSANVLDDIVLVLRPARGAWLAVTTWLNRRDDKHRTLDRSKYGTR